MKGLPEYFAQEYEQYPGAKEFSPEVLEIIKKYLPRNGIVLDIGCGTGTLEKYLKEDVGYVGLDSSSSSLNSFWQERVDESTSFVRNGVESSISLPFSDNSFDFILSKDMVVHLDDAMKSNLFKEVSRILKPRGVFIIVSFTANMVSPLAMRSKIDPVTTNPKTRNHSCYENSDSFSAGKIGPPIILPCTYYENMKSFKGIASKVDILDGYELIPPYFSTSIRDIESLLNGRFLRKDFEVVNTDDCNWYEGSVDKAVWVLKNK